MSGLLLLSYLMLWVLVVVLAIMMVGVLRLLGEYGDRGTRRASVLVTDEGVALATPAPAFVARNTRDEAVEFPPRGHSAICLFLTPTCKPCQDLIGPLNRFWDQERERYDFFVVLAGADDEVRAFGRLFQPAMPLILDATEEISSTFGHARTPYAYLVDDRGITRIKGVVNDEETLRALVEMRGQHAQDASWRRAATTAENCNSGVQPKHADAVLQRKEV